MNTRPTACSGRGASFVWQSTGAATKKGREWIQTEKLLL